jgi:bacterioferritin (cytochrome b1)
MSKAKKATKSKAKKADPLANALAWEKKTMDTYKKMEADATKKDDKMLMKLFGDLRKDAENHIKKIENTREKIKKAKAGKKTWF